MFLQVVSATNLLHVQYLSSGEAESLTVDELGPRVRARRRVRLRSNAYERAPAVYRSRAGRVRDRPRVVVIDGPRPTVAIAPRDSVAPISSPSGGGSSGSHAQRLPSIVRQRLVSSKISDPPPPSRQPVLQIRTSASGHAPLSPISETFADRIAGLEQLIAAADVSLCSVHRSHVSTLLQHLDQRLRELWRRSNSSGSALADEAPAPLPSHSSPGVVPTLQTLSVGQICWVLYDDAAFASGWHRGRVESVTAVALVSFATGSTEKIAPQFFAERLRVEYLASSPAVHTAASACAKRRAAQPLLCGLTDKPHASRVTFSRRDLLCWDLFSGPWKSVSLSVNRGLARGVCLSLDSNPNCSADITSRLEDWNPWDFVLRHYSIGHPRRCLLPFHVHASPPCTTYGFSHPFHGRSRAAPAADANSSPLARSADQYVSYCCCLV